MQNTDTDTDGVLHSRVHKDQHLPYTSELEARGNSMLDDDFNQYSTSYATSKLGRLTNKSLQQIKRIKSSLLSRDGFLKSGLLNVTNTNHPHFSAKSSFPHYTYNSTDSTLVQTRVKNEFQLGKKGELVDDETLEMDSVANEGGNKSISVVTYDIGKKKSRQNVVKSTYNLLLGDNEAAIDESNKVMRLATNPLDALDTDVAKMELQKKGDHESIA